MVPGAGGADKDGCWDPSGITMSRHVGLRDVVVDGAFKHVFFDHGLDLPRRRCWWNFFIWLGLHALRLRVLPNGVCASTSVRAGTGGSYTTGTVVGSSPRSVLGFG